MKMAKMHLPQIILEVAKNVVLWQFDGIKRAFVNVNKKGETVIKTDGINIEVRISLFML